MIISNKLIVLASKINKLLTADTEITNLHIRSISTAESCTGGLISAALTAIPGSSSYYDRGFITYSNQAKIDMLNVSQNTIDKFGAVSEETAKEMALGCLNNSSSHISLAVTGIAGPDGGTTKKPVGTVIFGIATSEDVFADKIIFQGNREEIREQAAIKGLQLIHKAILSSIYTNR